MPFTTEEDAITYLFRSLRTVRGANPAIERLPDEQTRDVSPTRALLRESGLQEAASPREYAVITGSKGKGSTTAIMAKLLQHLGHTVGMITSPHLVSFRERIRVNGRAISEADLVRIVNELQPFIDRIEATLPPGRYFSPQGLFLAIALRWFDELHVNAAVLEVGRGGRYDDVAVVPNKLSLFTPILIEHPYQLGPTLDRIAWHKAGIIKPYSYAYSVPQPPEVLDVIRAEAEMQHAEFAWIAPMDMGEYVRESARGIVMNLGRYGEVELSLKGRYQVENAALAVQGAGNLHGRLAGISHGSPEYVAAIRAGLNDVRWAGRMEKLSDSPAVWLDGATTVVAAESMIETLQGQLTDPVIAVIATPDDRDYAGVYRVMSRVSQHLILTETDINPKIHFPEPETALAAARQYREATFIPRFAPALAQAKALAGADGTVLLAVAQPIVGEAMLIAGYRFDQI
ncbi:MAG: hypothetical protein SF162_06330 [bacterium]|nr:hypothetical protein [bacterium]